MVVYKKTMQIILYLLIAIMVITSAFCNNFYYLVVFYSVICTLFCGFLITSDSLEENFFIFDLSIIYILIGFISTIGFLKYYHDVENESEF